MRSRRVTISDVAQSAGVSPTTVSHALNGKGTVRPATRARVMRAAQRLGYLPNSAARNLRSGRTATLGLMLPHDDPSAVEYYIELASAAAQSAFASEHGLLLLPQMRGIDELRRLAIDGAIVSDPTTRDPRVAAFEALGLPTVTIERDLGRPDDPWWVGVNGYEHTLTALEHLGAEGARRVALITGDAPWSWLHDGARAYEHWARERGQEPVIVSVPNATFERGAAAAAGELLDGADPPDAIFTAPDRFAIGALRAARSRGLSVPGDLLIAAGVDSSQARLMEPAITAVDLRPGEAGRAAVTMLLARIEGRTIEAPHSLEAELRVRASTARSAPIRL